MLGSSFVNLSTQLKTYRGSGSFQAPSRHFPRETTGKHKNLNNDNRFLPWIRTWRSRNANNKHYYCLNLHHSLRVRRLVSTNFQQGNTSLFKITVKPYGPLALFRSHLNEERVTWICLTPFHLPNHTECYMLRSEFNFASVQSMHSFFT
jgi:hypothetical protein